MVRWPQSSRALNCRLGPLFGSLFSRCHGVEHHFVALLEKVHRPPEYPKTLRLQVALKIPLGIPFFENTEFILILHALEKVASPASLLRPYGADQGSDRLGQLLALLRKNPHSDDD